MFLLSEAILFDSVTFLTIAVGSIILFYVWCFSFWSKKGVYTATPSIPFGNAKDLFLRNQCWGEAFRDAYFDIKSQGKAYGGYYIFGKPAFIPIDLDLIKTILTKDFVHFMNHINHVDLEADPISGHLFALKGAKWRQLRAKLTPTFTSGKIKMMFDILEECGKELDKVTMKYAENNEPIDIKEIVARFTTDIIGSCAFGIECNSLKDSDSVFRYYGKKVFEGTFIQNLVALVNNTWPELLDYIKLRTVPKDISDFFINLVTQTVGYREKNNITRKDFLQLMIELKNKPLTNENGEIKDGDKREENLTINELAAQAFVFFVAGYETSSTTVTFLLYEIAQQPDIQEKLRNEIDTVLEKHDGKLTYDATTELHYMEKCINESLRKYPPVPVHSRQCTQTYEVPNSDLVIEKGTTVLIPVLGIQNDPDIYPEPEKFDPERFSSENVSARHSAAWIPFGDGPRLCIGLRFGILQTKIALSHILKNFKFTLNSKTAVPMTFDPKSGIISVKNGVWLNLEKVN